MENVNKKALMTFSTYQNSEEVNKFSRLLNLFELRNSQDVNLEFDGRRQTDNDEEI